MSMKSVIFVGNWRDYFTGFSLNSFDDFFYYGDGRIINKNNKRDVSVLSLPIRDGGTGTFFLKRFLNPHIKDILSGWCAFGKATSQARLEYNNVMLLLKHGIDTYKPVCFGEETVLGVERRSFFITEKLNGDEFIDFLSQRWHGLKRDEQEKIMISMARLLRKAHDNDIVLPDAAVWHFFIRGKLHENLAHLSIIDLHRMRHNVTSCSRKIKDLSKLLWSMSADYFDSGHKDLFIREYTGSDGQDELNKITEKVYRRVNVLLKRHQPKKY